MHVLKCFAKAILSPVFPLAVGPDMTISVLMK